MGPKTSITLTPCLMSALSGLSRFAIVVIVIVILVVITIMVCTSQLIEGEISLPSTAEMEADWKRWVARNKVVVVMSVVVVMIVAIAMDS